MLRAALAASPPDVANRWVWPARWRHSARGPSVALQVEWQLLSVMDDRACVARFEVKTVDGGAATGEPAVLRHQVGNHLARLVVSAIAKPAAV